MTNTRVGRVGSPLFLYSLDGMVPHRVLVILSSISLCVSQVPMPFFEKLTLDHSCNVSFLLTN